MLGLVPDPFNRRHVKEELGKTSRAAIIQAIDDFGLRSLDSTKERSR